MSARIPLAVGAVACALAAPAGAAAKTPDLAQMTIGRSDLPAGTSVLAEGSDYLLPHVPEYYREFKLKRASGFARLNASLGLFNKPMSAGPAASPLATAGSP